jgi:undecaprenyl-diphosphatase
MRYGGSAMSALSYSEAIVVGAFQGVTELFPVSSLGHSVLIPALVGGRWARDLNVSAPESPYLAFIVGLHVATAAALLVFFWRDWARIVAGFVTSVRYRRVQTPAERLSGLPIGQGVLIGSAQILALLPGISRSGITMVAGLLRGLSHEDAARFAFLLATPVILAAGALKIPDLAGPLGAGIHGQVLAGSLASFVSAYLAVRYLTRYFQTRTLTPFAIYCVLAGAASLLWLVLR